MVLPYSPLDFLTLSTPRERYHAAANAGLELAWLRAEALEKFAACLIRHWPDDALYVHYTQFPPPRNEWFGGFYAKISCVFADPDRAPGAGAAKGNTVSKAQAHLRQCLREMSPLGHAELDRVTRLTNPYSRPLMSPEKWIAWPVQHRDPVFAAWLRQPELDQALPASLVRQPRGGRL